MAHRLKLVALCLLGGIVLGALAVWTLPPLRAWKHVAVLRWYDASRATRQWYDGERRSHLWSGHPAAGGLYVDVLPARYDPATGALHPPRLDAAAALLDEAATLREELTCDLDGDGRFGPDDPTWAWHWTWDDGGELRASASVIPTRVLPPGLERSRFTTSQRVRFESSSIETTGGRVQLVEPPQRSFLYELLTGN